MLGSNDGDSKEAPDSSTKSTDAELSSSGTSSSLDSDHSRDSTSSTSSLSSVRSNGFDTGRSSSSSLSEHSFAHLSSHSQQTDQRFCDSINLARSGSFEAVQLSADFKTVDPADQFETALVQKRHAAVEAEYDDGDDGFEFDSSDSEHYVSKRRKAKGFAAKTRHANLFVSAGTLDIDQHDDRIREHPAEAECSELQRRKTNPMHAAGEHAAALGDWQRHTTGIGLKLLAKMGFTGRLGKYEQGIAAPIEQRVHHGKVGIQEGPKREKHDFGAHERAASVAHQSSAALKRRARSTATSALKLELERKFDLLEKGMMVTLQSSEQEGRDMSAVYDRSKMLNELQNLKQAVPEVLGSVEMLISRRENEVRKLDDEIRRKRARIEIVEKQRLDIVARSRLFAERLSQIENLQILARRLEDATTLPDFVRAAIEIYSLWPREGSAKGLQGQFEIQHARLGVPSVTALLYQMAAPKLAASLRSAMVTVSRDCLLPAASRLPSESELYTSLLQLANLDSGISGMEYNKLLVLTILKHARESLSRAKVGDSESDMLAQMLSILRAALSDALIDCLALDVVLPWLRDGLGRWDPLSDPVSPHVWIFAWLPVIGKRHVQSLFPAFSIRIGRFMSAWTPRDVSVLTLLTPWKPVARREELNGFFEDYVSKPMRGYLRALSAEQLRSCVGPQDCQPLLFVLRWCEVLQPGDLAETLLENLMPQWIDALGMMISAGFRLPTSNSWGDTAMDASSAAVLQEATQWYLSWKNEFTMELGETREMRVAFTSALDLINAVVDGEFPSTRASPRAFLDARVAELRTRGIPTRDRNAPKLDRASAPDVSVRDVVAHRASTHGIVFAPSARTANGHRLYHFGPILVYFDAAERGVIMARNPPHSTPPFSPISLDDLTALATAPPP